MNAISTEVSVSVVAGFAGDGRVYRAFNHLLASRPGEMLLVPLGRTVGDLRAVVDACPLPWAEVWAVLDAAPAAPALVPPESLCAEHPRLAMITPYGWVRDALEIGATRLTHASGIRFALAAGRRG